MEQGRRTLSVSIGLAVLMVVGVMAITLLQPSESMAATSYDLPMRTPRPEPTVPTSVRNPADLEGARIWLDAEFSANWPWETDPWYEVWTKIQWQDKWGAWHDVEGWEGTLFDIENRDGVYHGWVWCWVPEELFGQGPFRWVVYEQRDGAVTAISDLFDLPDRRGETVVVRVLLVR